MLRSEATIDLAAIRANAEAVRSLTGTDVMAVVKADGYGHGMIPAARAALAGGASWLGVALLEEALALREAGFTEPLLAWLWTPQDFALLTRALAVGVDVSVSSIAALQLVCAASAEQDEPARVHLKADTGLSRNGATEADWPDLLDAAGKAVESGQLEVIGIWSHLVRSEEPDHPTTTEQVSRFEAALARAVQAGIEPPVRHLANSAGALTVPAARFDLVRIGIALYGLSPVVGQDFGLRPAMTLRSHLANVKRLPAGQGIGYGHVYRTAEATTAALVPLGYGDGIPRSATNLGPVAIGGRRFRVSGRVAMDQFVVDVGDATVVEGDEVILFGPGTAGEPTAQEWADALDTIHYEVVTRIGARVPRRHTDTDTDTDTDTNGQTSADPGQGA
ncbi:alanine racemase [Jatrophihabitans telluris]|uniref:Alanine racemase n=1 Tax=Jatrophihabitans telluris TaxID=2038343 RepID=A0ABY4QYC2_9ACTN|nr:alanine racemase [Jatrophihabitans telluris]UQX87915.1 alanine racemase [Jatrophihabitans telluris]